MVFSTPQAKVPFAEYAKSFLRTHGIREVEEGERGLATVLEDGYIVVQLGLFDVWFPREDLRDSRGSKVFKEAASALLEMQELWIDRVAEGDQKKEAAKDLKILFKWIRSWKNGRLARKPDEGAGRPDLLAVLEAGDDVSEASKRIGDLMVEGRFLEEAAPLEKPLLLILSPTRENFLGLGSFVGSLNETNRSVLWNDGLAMWTSFNRGDVHVIAMEHPANFPGNGDITQGLDMNSREKTGLLQHVIQHACELMLDAYYLDRLPSDLMCGLAINMVIDMYKENNVRAGGGSGGNTTAAFSKFVAGGRSSGGMLAARNADSRWRDSKGKDHFIEALQLAQKAGAKEALKIDGKGRDRQAYFALVPDGGGPAHCIRAPFFMDSASASPVPEDCENDFLEFFRTYRSAFAYWLESKARSSMDRASSAELLQRLLKISGPPQAGGMKSSFEDRILRIYGIPFSGEDGSSESLEWQFLGWLCGKK